MHKHATLSTPDGKTIISATCIECGESKQFEVDSTHYDAWLNGALIQGAMPEIEQGDRELLISGLCDLCFNAMFEEDWKDLS